MSGCFFVLLRVLYEVVCLTKNCQAGVFHPKTKHSLRRCLSSLSYIAKILNSTCGFYKNRSHIHENLITKDSFLFCGSLCPRKNRLTGRLWGNCFAAQKYNSSQQAAALACILPWSGSYFLLVGRPQGPPTIQLFQSQIRKLF